MIRHWGAAAAAAAFISTAAAASPPANPPPGGSSLPAALTAPAHLTPRALHGLFTAISRAGNRLVAVGEQGRIMVSDDNGAAWRQVPAPTSVTLTAVTFANPQDGWAAGQMGVILRTRDGGRNWTRVFNGADANAALFRAAQADAKAQPDSQAAKADLLAAKQFVNGGVTVPFLALRALSPTDVIAAGGFGMAFKSQDGGQHWQPIFDSIPNPSGFNIYGVLPADGQLFFLGEQGFLAERQADGRYTALTAPASGTFFGGIAVRGGALLLYGLQGTVLRSNDGGMHWAAIPTNVTVGIDAATTLADGRILLGDTAGDLLLSQDQGARFTVAAQAGEPVAALALAANGDIIVGGPLGLRDIKPADLHPGV